MHALGQRAYAVTFDTALCIVLLLGIFWLTGARLEDIVWNSLPDDGALRLAYHTLNEGQWGTTLGKRIARLREVAVDGGRLGLRRAFKRNLIRLVDALGLYLVGLVVAARPRPARSQRLGDRWAGTLIVDERRVQALLAAHRQRSRRVVASAQRGRS